MNGEPKKAEMTAEELPLHKTDKRTGISYTLVGDYYYPDLEAPEAPEVELGQYARMRKKYLKEHRRILYSELLSDCKLIEHLHETEQEALDMEERLIRQMAKQKELPRS